jgi:hypothetical protein
MPDIVAPCGMIPPGFGLHVESHEPIFLFVSHQVSMLRETPFGGIPLGKDRGPVDHRSWGPGSSGKSMLKAPAQFGAKKDIHILHCCLVKQNRT